MPNPNKVWGQVRIKIDGAVLDTEGKSSLEPGGTMREAVQADFKAGFHTESTVESKVTCSVLLTAGVSVTALQEIDDATVTFEADTGQTYVIRHAYCSNKVSASEGKAQLELSGPPAEELTV